MTAGSPGADGSPPRAGRVLSGEGCCFVRLEGTSPLLGRLRVTPGAAAGRDCPVCTPSVSTRGSAVTGPDTLLAAQALAAVLGHLAGPWQPLWERLMGSGFTRPSNQWLEMPWGPAWSARVQS